MSYYDILDVDSPESEDEDEEILDTRGVNRAGPNAGRARARAKFLNCGPGRNLTGPGRTIL